jgi:hypothetical protein
MALTWGKFSSVVPEKPVLTLRSPVPALGSHSIRWLRGEDWTHYFGTF